MLLRLLLVGQGGLGQGQGGQGGLAALLTRLFKEEEEAVLLKVLLVEQVGEEVVGKREVGKREGATCDGLRGAVQCSSALSHKYWFYELAPYPTKIAFLKLLKNFWKSGIHLVHRDQADCAFGVEKPTKQPNLGLSSYLNNQHYQKE